MKKLEVIILGQHIWNTLGQIRSYGEIGIKSNVIWVKEGVLTPQGSRYIKSFHSCMAFEDAIDYMVNIFNAPNKRYIVSTDSDKFVFMLNQHYNELKDKYIFFNAGKNGRLNRFMQKPSQINLVEEYGFIAPKTEIVKRGELPQKVAYPIFTKAPDSFIYNWKENSFICRNQKELFEAYEHMAIDSVILQEYIEKDNEVAIEGLSYNNGKDVYLPIQGEYLRIKDGDFGTWKKNEVYHLGDDFKSKICAIMRHIGYNGVFEIEFLRDKHGNLYFLEINFRHTQYNHALSDMGVNMCKLFAVSQIEGVINENQVKIKSPSITMHEGRDFNKFVKTGEVSIVKWIRDIRKTDSFYSYDKRDKLFLFKKLAFLVYYRTLLLIKKHKDK